MTNGPRRAQVGSLYSVAENDLQQGDELHSLLRGEVFEQLILRDGQAVMYFNHSQSPCIGGAD